MCREVPDCVLKLLPQDPSRRKLRNEISGLIRYGGWCDASGGRHYTALCLKCLNDGRRRWDRDEMRWNGGSLSTIAEDILFTSHRCYQQPMSAAEKVSCWSYSFTSKYLLYNGCRHPLIVPRKRLWLHLTFCISMSVFGQWMDLFVYNPTARLEARSF